MHAKSAGRVKGSANPNYRNAQRRAICPTCGLEFGYYGKRTHKFCSQKCVRHINLRKKGLRAEYRARDVLRALGYVVARSAGSLGAFDLVALKGSECLLIQVKSGKPAGQPEGVFRADLKRLEGLDVRAKKELWLWIDHQGWFVLGWNGTAWVPGMANAP